MAIEVRTMLRGLPWLDKVGDPTHLARAARRIMLAADHKKIKVSEALEQLDALLDTYGVEEISSRMESFREGPAVYFRYLNTGDPYTPTIVRWGGRWYVRAWGDVVESQERRGVRFD